MIRRALLILATVLTLGIAASGVANADVPALFVGASPTNSGDCIGVILDQDGHYNHMDGQGHGYDALLCSPGDTRQAFGWGHAGGYYIGSGGHCVREEVFTGGTFHFIRNICTATNQTLTRFLDSVNFYRVTILS